MKNSLAVEEFQGYYGPFEVSELLIQKIWLQGAFDASRLKDDQGRSVEVCFPGRWNRLGGPDFKDAILLVDGKRVEGHVEIHFACRDWAAHGHQDDPSYDGVVLHVVYHPLREGEAPARLPSGAAIPCVSLMELLWHDLEEYASEDSLLASTRMERDAALEDLYELDLPGRRERLREHSLERWRLKKHFARKRIERYGWEEACHSSALEILGYAANRIPMLLISGACPLDRMRAEELGVEELWGIGEGKWTLQGCRPANHPRLRLGQYLEWVRERPGWPTALRKWGRRLPLVEMGDGGSFAIRKGERLADWRELLVDDVMTTRMSGSKVDTLVCDGFFPLLAVDSETDLFPLWFHWFAGNAPEGIVSGLRRLQVLQPRRYPLANGWIQGVLGLRARAPAGLREQESSLEK